MQFEGTKADGGHILQKETRVNMKSMPIQPYDAFRQKPFPRKRSLIEKGMDVTGMNRFFLREGKRPAILADPTHLTSPVEGKLVEIETLAPAQPIRGKSTLGRPEFYRFEDLVHTPEMASVFEGGLCFNIYLSPLNLHYIISPTELTVRKLDYHSNFCRPILFMKSGEIHNERLVIYTETRNGVPMIIIFVGSFMVAGLECVKREGDTVQRGELIGGFKLGSTVMLLFPKDTVAPLLKPHTPILLHEPFAQWNE